MIRHSQTHTSKDIQNITKIILGRKMLGVDVNPRHTRHELSLIFGGWVLGYSVPPQI